MTNDECVELAIRITQRAKDGVVSFRLLTAAEELPMVRAFDDVFGRLIATLAHAEVIAAENDLDCLLQVGHGGLPVLSVRSVRSVRFFSSPPFRLRQTIQKHPPQLQLASG